MGLLCCPVGLAMGLYIANGQHDGGWERFFVYSGSAAFAIPALLWFILVEQSRKRTNYRAALAGALGAALAHYFTWYFMMASMRISYLLTGKPVTSLGEPTLDLLEGLWGSLVYGVLSLVSYGWITLPAGFVIGYVYEIALSRNVISEKNPE